MAEQVELSEFQRSNLKQLSAYLRTLPTDYPDFEMASFTSDDSDVATQVSCGTAACAAGHGPVAGIAPEAGENWWDYAERCFVADTKDGAWDWVFSSGWATTDNTVHGAADRIDWLLSRGVPDKAFEQRRGEAPLCYGTSVSA